jgi:hypothetical protein
LIVPPGHCGLTFLSCGWLVAIDLTRPAARAEPEDGGVDAEDVLALAVVEVFVVVDDVLAPAAWFAPEPLLDPPHPASSRQPVSTGAATAKPRRLRTLVKVIGIVGTVAKTRRAGSVDPALVLLGAIAPYCAPRGYAPAQPPTMTHLVVPLVVV